MLLATNNRKLFRKYLKDSVLSYVKIILTYDTFWLVEQFSGCTKDPDSVFLLCSPQLGGFALPNLL